MSDKFYRNLAGFLSSATATQSAWAEVGFGKIRPAQACPMELGPAQIGAEKIRLIGIGPFQVGAEHVGETQVRLLQTAMTEIDPSHQRPGKIDFWQPQTGQVGETQFRPFAANLAVNEALVAQDCVCKFLWRHTVSRLDPNIMKGGPLQLLCRFVIPYHSGGFRLGRLRAKKNRPPGGGGRLLGVGRDPDLEALLRFGNQNVCCPGKAAIGALIETNGLAFVETGQA